MCCCVLLRVVVVVVVVVSDVVVVVLDAGSDVQCVWPQVQQRCNESEN